MFFRFRVFFSFCPLLFVLVLRLSKHIPRSNSHSSVYRVGSSLVGVLWIGHILWGSTATQTSRVCARLPYKLSFKIRKLEKSRIHQEQRRCRFSGRGSSVECGRPAQVSGECERERKEMRKEKTVPEIWRAMSNMLARVDKGETSARTPWILTTRATWNVRKSSRVADKVMSRQQAARRGSKS